MTGSVAMIRPDYAIRSRSNEFLPSIGTLWKNILFALVLVITALTLSGCVSPKKMAFQKDTDTVTATTGAVFLMTATLKNNYRTFFQPWARSVIIERALHKKDRLSFLIDTKARNNESFSSELGNSYFFRMELEKGIYVIRGLSGQGGVVPLSSFFVPLHAQIASAGSGIFYLGHVSAVVRERVDNEFRAGILYPFIDQAATGYSGGTFDIEITDQFEKDEPEFRSRFPALKDVSIQKTILPPFDRAKAQQWWEDHWSNTY